MIPNDQPLRNETIKRMLDYLDARIQTEVDDMTDWERNFILSIANQFELKGSLSEKQTNILEKIYDKENK